MVIMLIYMFEFYIVLYTIAALTNLTWTVDDIKNICFTQKSVV